MACPSSKASRTPRLKPCPAIGCSACAALPIKTVRVVLAGCAFSSDSEFRERLAAHFGARVRGFTRIESRRTFPLSLEFARPASTSRIVLIGNAAQALHPIAGQGFNLGVRDAFELGQAINQCSPATLGDRDMIARYTASRRVDRVAGIAFTHGLTRIFTSELAFVRWPRGLALTMLDAIPSVKKAFTRAMLFGLS